MLHNNFVYLDFIVVQAPQVEVLRAIAVYRAEMGTPDPTAKPTAFPGHDGSDRRSNMLGKVWFFLKQRIVAPKDAPIDLKKNAESLFLHLDEAAELDRMITWSQDEQSSAPPINTRVSCLEPNPEWTLIEFAGLIGGTSTIGMRLSEEMPEEDVFYFRRSGSEAKEPHFDYHHYRAGEQRRRVMSHCNLPTDGPPWWEGYSDGPMLHFEDPKAYDTEDESTILTADKQADILARMGVPLGALFDPDMRIDPVLISDKPGGAPLSALLD